MYIDIQLSSFGHFNNYNTFLPILFKDKIFYSLIRIDHYIITILNPYVLYELSIAKIYLY